MSSLRQQVLTEVHDLAESTLARVASIIEANIVRKQSQPAIWWAFHRTMSLRLPRFRVVARAWHRMRARRYEAMTAALRKAGNPVALALAEHATGGRV